MEPFVYILTALRGTESVNLIEALKMLNSVGFPRDDEKMIIDRAKN